MLTNYSGINKNKKDKLNIKIRPNMTQNGHKTHTPTRRFCTLIRRKNNVYIGHKQNRGPLKRSIFLTYCTF